MRHTDVRTHTNFTDTELCEYAKRESNSAVDDYSNYRVGAAIEVQLKYRYEKTVTVNRVYTGHNIRISGMQVTRHAEQLAAMSIIMDANNLGDHKSTSLKKIAVVTSGDDKAIKCGHCMQVLSSVCEYTGTNPSEFDVIAGNYSDTEEWDIDKYTLHELIGDTYVTNRN